MSKKSRKNVVVESLADVVVGDDALALATLADDGGPAGETGEYSLTGPGGEWAADDDAGAADDDAGAAVSVEPVPPVETAAVEPVPAPAVDVADAMRAAFADAVANARESKPAALPVEPAAPLTPADAFAAAVAARRAAGVSPISGAAAGKGGRASKPAAPREPRPPAAPRVGGRVPTPECPFGASCNAPGHDMFGRRDGSGAADINSVLIRASGHVLTRAQIVERSGRPVAGVSPHLAHLCYQGLVEHVAGGYAMTKRACDYFGLTFKREVGE